MDIKLDTAGDMDITSNLLTLVTGIDSIAQHWLIRMRTFLGEWFLDQRIGIPYFQYILVKNPNVANVRNIFYQASLGTPGIKEITAFNFDLDTATRILTIDISGVTEDLDTFKFVFSEMILSQEAAIAV